MGGSHHSTVKSSAARVRVLKGKSAPGPSSLNPRFALKDIWIIPVDMPLGEISALVKSNPQLKEKWEGGVSLPAFSCREIWETSKAGKGEPSGRSGAGHWLESQFLPGDSETPAKPSRRPYGLAMDHFFHFLATSSARRNARNKLPPRTL